jgi:hypothetical protein
MKKIKIVISESSYSVPSYDTSARFTHMGDDYRLGDHPTPKDTPVDAFHGEMLPQPRARVSYLEQYGKAYAYLMGAGSRAATGSSIEQIMEASGAGDPQSVAQALADYMNDRARLK